MFFGLPDWNTCNGCEQKFLSKIFLLKTRGGIRRIIFPSCFCKARNFVMWWHFICEITKTCFDKFMPRLWLDVLSTISCIFFSQCSMSLFSSFLVSTALGGIALESMCKYAYVTIFFSDSTTSPKKNGSKGKKTLLGDSADVADLSFWLWYSLFARTFYYGNIIYDLEILSIFCCFYFLKLCSEIAQWKKFLSRASINFLSDSVTTVVR